MLSAATRAAAGVVRCLVLAVSGGAGAVVGAVVGLLSASIDEDDLIEAMLARAIAGAVVSVELIEYIGRIWSLDDCSTDSWIRNTLFLLGNLEDGDLPRVSLFPTIGSAPDSQMQPDYSRPGVLFEPNFPRSAAVERLPATTITKDTVAAWQETTCPICIHEIQAGERSRTLPACRHVFHLACIDTWLLRKSQCPMCRHAVD
ncbi:unnamed protein product [Alopecurus aequalis]